MTLQQAKSLLGQKALYTICDALADIYGYGATDFEDYTKEELINYYLGDDQIVEVAVYLQ